MYFPEVQGTIVQRGRKNLYRTHRKVHATSELQVHDAIAEHEVPDLPCAGRTHQAAHTTSTQVDPGATHSDETAEAVA